MDPKSPRAYFDAERGTILLPFAITPVYQIACCLSCLTVAAVIHSFGNLAILGTGLEGLSNERV